MTASISRSGDKAATSCGYEFRDRGVSAAPERCEPTAMRRPLFLPTARQTNWLLIVAFLAVGQALYIRYMAIENLNTELACQAGLQTWLCTAFRISIVFFNHEVFGWVALARCPSQPDAAFAYPDGTCACRGGLRRRAAQCRSVGARRGLADPQPGTSRARPRIRASPIRPAHSQIACQLANVSLIAM